MEQRVRVDIVDGVADVRLVRTDKMNALDDAMVSALIDAADRLRSDRTVRAAVVSGDGRAFCAGLDSSSFSRMTDASIGFELDAHDHGPANRYQYAVWCWRELPVPVIAAVHGVAFGGGFQLMLGCDLRYVAPDAKLSIMEIKWGLIPDMAGAQLMWRLAREDVVRELTYTGRIFSGEEAGRIGFATRVVDDPRAEALSTAREIAAKSPDAIRAAKRLLNNAADRDLAEGLAAESREQGQLIGSPNQVEAVMANLQNRAPNFVD